MGECVKVIVRCRPMNTRENDLKCKNVISMDSDCGRCSITNPAESKSDPKTFTFDGAYFTDSTTEAIYNEIAYPLVEGVTEGYNGTIFAYGQTGCGKSFSMQGITDPASQRGIIPRAFDHIFETISVTEGVKYLVTASYLEIYNEEIRDLLGKDVKQKLDLHEHPEKGVYIPGLSKHTVHNVADCEKVMAKGWKNRSTGATLMNADSSRSHSIFTIHMEMMEEENGKEHIRVGKLNLVDLAGSERQGKTGATGDRLKEANKINLSLSALGNVISALVDGKSKHIPYRDSKLTRLLQDSLADNNYDETLSTLRYANRAKNIKNKPKINEDPKDAMLREYKEEIEKLKRMLEGKAPVEYEKTNGHQAPPPPQQADLESERLKIKQEYETEISSLREKYEAERGDREKIQREMERLNEFYNSKLENLETDGALLESDEVDAVGEANLAFGGSQRPASLQTTLSPTDFGNSQRAVHLGSSRANVQDGSLSPTDMSKEALLSKLQELQAGLVGGEQINNEEVKQRRKKRRKYADEKKAKLAAAVQNMEDEGIMLNIYETIEDELKVKNKLLEKEKKRSTALSQEIADIQSEFEFDRIDYLETIRKQERQLKLNAAIMERIQPLLRRDCNYYNIDRIKSECRWNEETSQWTLPDLVIEKTTLPSAGGSLPRSARSMGAPSPPGGPPMSLRDEDDGDRYLQRLSQRDQNGEDMAKSYFKRGRQDKLLNARSNIGSASSLTPSALYNGQQSPASTSDYSLDDSLRKPARLEALQPVKGVRRK